MVPRTSATLAGTIHRAQTRPPARLAAEPDLDPGRKRASVRPAQLRAETLRHCRLRNLGGPVLRPGGCPGVTRPLTYPGGIERNRPNSGLISTGGFAERFHRA